MDIFEYLSKEYDLDAIEKQFPGFKDYLKNLCQMVNPKIAEAILFMHVPTFIPKDKKDIGSLDIIIAKFKLAIALTNFGIDLEKDKDILFRLLS